ncbi:spermidine synthase [Candidatus Tenderia electrophaga]|jgi:spermidine synthase|uniref:Polyamine aminopropyltransferase n=1 Tax=Candidatus Tenderia electrophaga TaxID=1748243 RepID=A0A0S2TH21_9GAMM|nr:spermidine synthase [Candidatus Tenderia electrophaga]
MTLDESWFSEIHAGAGSAFSLKITEKLHEEQTPFQYIEIFDTETFGRLMVIDGCYMVTGRDNFLYHEMMTHPALFTHPDPKRVLIIGGGDCGTLREVLKHQDVERVWQVDIDEAVTRLSEKYLPELCESNGDIRARLLFEDGIKWIENAEDASIDVIIVDSTDPVGPAEGLFGASFYRQCQRALHSDGILIQQSESPLLHLDLLKDMHSSMRDAGFRESKTLHFPQPCYPSGWWSATMASKETTGLDGFRADDVRNKTFKTRYYNAGIHKAALTQPEFCREAGLG